MAKAKNPNKARKGAANGRWRGGKVIQSGYVKERMPDSPLADSSGYAYSHRVKTGAKPGEQVHHEDGDRLNNSSGNLKREKDLAAHNAERAGKKKSDDKDKKPPAKKKSAKKPEKKDNKGK